jgi:hypothetical protein
MPDQNDPQGERIRIDGRKFREIPLGQLSVDAQGKISIIRPPAKATPGGTVQDITTSGRRGH